MKQLFSSGRGIIAFYAGACGAVYLLQLFPVTGIFFMFLMAIIWIGILIHIMMLHLAIAGGMRQISVWWLSVPICYYAGGYMLHLYSGQQARILASEIEVANTVAKTTVEQPFIYLMKDDQALQLFYRYRVPQAFAKQNDGEFIQYDHAYGPDCNAPLRWSHEKRFEPYQFRPDLFSNYKGTDKVWQCVIARNVKSAQWRYRVETEALRTPSYLNPRQGMRWRVIDQRSDAVVTTVETASIQTLPPVQTVVAGCFLNDSASTWECGAFLWSSYARVTAGYKSVRPKGNPFLFHYDAENLPVSALGQALSLEPRRPNSR